MNSITLLGCKCENHWEKCRCRSKNAACLCADNVKPGSGKHDLLTCRRNPSPKKLGQFQFLVTWFWPESASMRNLSGKATKGGFIFHSTAHSYNDRRSWEERLSSDLADTHWRHDCCQHVCCPLGAGNKLIWGERHWNSETLLQIQIHAS